MRYYCFKLEFRSTTSATLPDELWFARGRRRISRQFDVRRLFPELIEHFLVDLDLAVALHSFLHARQIIVENLIPPLVARGLHQGIALLNELGHVRVGALRHADHNVVVVKKYR